MKKTWKMPMLEVLDIRMTMNGPGKAVPDCYDVGEANGHNSETHDGMSNNACKPKGGGSSPFDS